MMVEYSDVLTAVHQEDVVKDVSRSELAEDPSERIALQAAF